jgi:putative ABC transport system permease protein
MEIALIRGRHFTLRDDESAPPAVIVNEALARRQWPGADPIGRQIAMKDVSDGPPILLTIVGVVKNARQSGWTREPRDEVYLPYLQRPGAFGLTAMTFVARTTLPPAGMAETVRRRIHAVDAAVPLSPVVTMDQVIADRLWRSRLSALLLTAFAAIALLLAAVGIYGVIACAARQRTQEIGVRMALGASRGAVVRLVIGESLGPITAGLVLGTAGALGATRFLASQLYRVTPTDPVTFVLVVTGLAGTGLLAAVLPAWRAARADPLAALRHE